MITLSNAPIFCQHTLLLIFFQQKEITSKKVEKKWGYILEKFKNYEENKDNKNSRVRKPEDYDVLASFLFEGELNKDFGGECT